MKKQTNKDYISYDYNLHKPYIYIRLKRPVKKAKDNLFPADLSPNGAVLSRHKATFPIRRLKNTEFFRKVSHTTQYQCLPLYIHFFWDIVSHLSFCPKTP